MGRGGRNVSTLRIKTKIGKEAVKQSHKKMRHEGRRGSMKQRGSILVFENKK